MTWLGHPNYAEDDMVEKLQQFSTSHFMILIIIWISEKTFYYNLNRWKGCFYHILHFYCILNNILKGMKEVQMDTEFEQKI